MIPWHFTHLLIINKLKNGKSLRSKNHLQTKPVVTSFGREEVIVKKGKSLEDHKGACSELFIPWVPGVMCQWSWTLHFMDSSLDCLRHVSIKPCWVTAAWAASLLLFWSFLIPWLFPKQPHLCLVPCREVGSEPGAVGNGISWAGRGSWEGSATVTSAIISISIISTAQYSALDNWHAGSCQTNAVKNSLWP